MRTKNAYMITEVGRCQAHLEKSLSDHRNDGEELPPLMRRNASAAFLDRDELAELLTVEELADVHEW